MTGSRLLSKLLRFKGFRVVSWWFEGRSCFVIAVKPHKNGCCCPECGRRGKIVRTMPHPRRWRDIPVCGWRVWLLYHPWEIRCPTHGRVVEEIPWAERFSRVTYRFEYAMLRYCQTMTQKAASELLRISASTLSDLLRQASQVRHARLRSGPLLRGVGWPRQGA